MSKLGHHRDGSGIQNHSVGGLYPCIQFKQETPNGQKWGLITPKDQHGTLYESYEETIEAANKYNNKS